MMIRSAILALLMTGGGDRRALPYAFTQQGIGMLSGLLSRCQSEGHGHRLLRRVGDDNCP